MPIAHDPLATVSRRLSTVGVPEPLLKSFRAQSSNRVHPRGAASGDKRGGKADREQ